MRIFVILFILSFIPLSLAETKPFFFFENDTELQRLYSTVYQYDLGAENEKRAWGLLTKLKFKAYSKKETFERDCKNFFEKDYKAILFKKNRPNFKRVSIDLKCMHSEKKVSLKIVENLKNKTAKVLFKDTFNAFWAYRSQQHFYLKNGNGKVYLSTISKFNKQEKDQHRKLYSAIASLKLEGGNNSEYILLQDFFYK